MCLKAILESSNNYLLYSYKLRETFRLGYGFVCMSRCMTLTQSTSLIWEKILSWFNNTCTWLYFLKCHDVNTGSFFIYCRICNNLITCDLYPIILNLFQWSWASKSWLDGNTWKNMSEFNCLETGSSIPSFRGRETEEGKTTT